MNERTLSDLPSFSQLSPGAERLLAMWFADPDDAPGPLYVEIAQELARLRGRSSDGTSPPRITRLVDDFERAVRAHEARGDKDHEARDRWVKTLSALYQLAGLVEEWRDARHLLITADWLAEVGFKWHQVDRQPSKHWVLWIGDACGASGEDLGIEVTAASDGKWFCWFRSDSSHRYHRFVHLRHLRTRAELIGMFEGLTGLPWDPSNHIGGHARTPEQAARWRQESLRMDLQMRTREAAWYEIEKDETRGKAMPEHLEQHALTNEVKPK